MIQILLYINKNNTQEIKEIKASNYKEFMLQHQEYNF